MSLILYHSKSMGITEFQIKIIKWSFVQFNYIEIYFHCQKNWNNLNTMYWIYLLVANMGVSQKYLEFLGLISGFIFTSRYIRKIVYPHGKDRIMVSNAYMFNVVTAYLNNPIRYHCTRVLVLKLQNRELLFSCPDASWTLT